MGFPIFGQPFGSRFGRGMGQGGNFPYRLLDTFTTPRAAGNVNGTPADGTGQLRVVTDGNLKLSIGNNLLNFATGGVGAGNPGLWYPALTTVPGTIHIAIITPGSTGPNAGAGWDTDQTGQPFINGIRFAAPNLVNVLFNAGLNVSTGAFTNGSTYKIISVQRTNGYYFFIKGGSEYPNVTKIWDSLIGAAGSIFPAIGAVGGTAAVQTAGMIKVPFALYIPPIFAYDTFTRSNGALGNTESVGPDGQTLVPIAWNTPTGTWAITTNKAGASALAGGLAIATIPVPSKDNFVETALTRAGGIVGVVGRYADASNYIYAYHDGTNAGVKQRLAAVETDLIAATAATFAANAVLRLEMDGNNCTLFYNNVRIGGTGAINAGLSAAVNGLYTTDTGNTFDLVNSSARGTSGEYATLDTM